MSPQVRSTLLLLLAALIWGSTFVAQSVGAGHVSAFVFLGARSWLAVLTLLPVLRLRTARVPAGNRRALVRGGILCGVILFLATTVQQIGIACTTTAKAGFITALYILIVPVALALMGRRPPLRLWICVALALVGLRLLCAEGAKPMGTGDALIMLCALFYAVHLLIIDRFASFVDGIALSCLQFLVCAVLATLCLPLAEIPTASAIADAMPSILYAGVLSGGVGYTLQIIAQKGLSPTVAGLVMSFEGVFAALSGWLVLGEALTLREIIGCALMFAAIVLPQLPQRPRGKSA